MRAMRRIASAMVDAVRKIMANIEAGHGEGDADYADLVATLERLQVTGGVETVATTHSRTEAQRVTEVLETIASQVASVCAGEPEGVSPRTSDVVRGLTPNGTYFRKQLS